MLHLEIEIDGQLYSPDSGEWINQLALFVNENLEITPDELAHIAAIAAGEIKRDITDAVDFEGNALLPLMPSTIKAKGSSKILRNSDALLNSIVANKITDKEYEVTTGVDYDIFLQYGTKHMVSRPFFGFTSTADSMIDEYLKILGYKTAA